jgi:NADH dehydrogenase
MTAQSVTVVGGTGFLGRRVVRHLLDSGFAVRSASRHPDRGMAIFHGPNWQIESVHADVNEDGSVAAAVRGVSAVVNAVSLYVERGKDTFQSVHVGAAERVARLAREAGAEKFLHVSGIGADARSTSPYCPSSEFLRQWAR